MIFYHFKQFLITFVCLFTSMNVCVNLHMQAHMLECVWKSEYNSEGWFSLLCVSLAIRIRSSGLVQALRTRLSCQFSFSNIFRCVFMIIFIYPSMWACAYVNATCVFKWPQETRGVGFLEQTVGSHPAWLLKSELGSL